MVAKCLAYDDDDIALAAATLSPDAVPEGRLVAQEEDLASLLELPDPDVSGDTSVISAAPDDALIASADSCVTEVGGDRSRPVEFELLLRLVSAANFGCVFGVFGLSSGATAVLIATNDLHLSSFSSFDI